MILIQDQVAAVAKANLEAQFALYGALTSKTLESVVKLINLNIAAARATMEESAVVTRQMLAARNAQEAMSLMSAQSRPSVEKAMSYGGHLANIANGFQFGYGKEAEEQLSRIRQDLRELMEDAKDKGPAGADALVALMTSALDSASAGYAQLARTGRDAVEATGAGVSQAAAQLAGEPVEAVDTEPAKS